jgi:serine/threonine protein kinase
LLALFPVERSLGSAAGEWSIVTIAEDDIPAGYSGPRHIGQGGWADVYRCTNEGELVALKVSKHSLGDVANDADFRTEFDAAATLSTHPGVIRLYEGGVSLSGRTWLAMELAEQTVADLIKRGPIPLDRALEISANVADTLTWAHTKSFLHGDLKPSNILLDRDGRPRLTDFGVTKRLDNRHSVTSNQFTQSYAAPELIEENRASVPADVWSLAGTLFEMLTGRVPFLQQPGEGLGPFIKRVQRGLPADAIPSSVPAVVADIIRAAMTVDRGQRTPSAAAFAQAVRAAQQVLLLTPTPPLPTPDPWTQPEARYVSYSEAMSQTRVSPPKVEPPVQPMPDAAPPSPRRRWALVASAAAVVVILAGTGIAFATNGGGTPSNGARQDALGTTPQPTPSPSATLAGPAAVPTLTTRAAKATSTVGSHTGSGGSGGSGGQTTTKPATPTKTTAPPPLPPITDLGITTSASGTVVSFTVSVNPNGRAATVEVDTSLQSHTFATGTGVWSWSSSDNIGYSATDTINVTVSDSGRSSLSSSRQQSTGASPPPPPPQPTVTVSRGTPCGGGGGAACAGGTCSSSVCGYIHVTTANFSGNVTCTFNSQQGSGGFVSATWGPNQSKDSPDWFGYANQWVSATCGGVTGTFTWP